MRAAIEIARNHKTPFGAALVNEENEVIMTAANTADRDGPLAHAEMNLLAKAQKECTNLEGHILYSTCEPCPMCMSAIIWAGISSVVFGATISDAKEFIPQIDVSAQTIADNWEPHISIQKEFLRGPCVELFVEFAPQH